MRAIPLCTSGHPNRVGSPQFVLSDVASGTTVVEFRLKDLDVPGCHHGGGKVRLKTSGTVPMGVFNYKSSCPPNGSYTHEWTAQARAGGKVLATAMARRS